MNKHKEQEATIIPKSLKSIPEVLNFSQFNYNGVKNTFCPFSSLLAFFKR